MGEPAGDRKDCSRPRRLRLSRSSEFARVREGGDSASGGYFRMSALRVPEPCESRVGIVTSRRVGGAVERNRVRRRLREIHRLGRADLAPGFWIVVVARREAAAATFLELRREWLRMAKKLSILRSA